MKQQPSNEPIKDPLKHTWAKLLKLYRERAGMNKTELARRMGVTNGYITKLEAGQLPPPEPLRQKFCHVLNLSEAECETFHIRAEMDRSDPTALKWISKLLPPEFRESPQGKPQFYLPEEGQETAAGLVRVPIINKASAGLPQDFTDLEYPPGVADQYVAVPDITDPNAFAFYVDGDSMEPDFPDGTLLIASPNTVPVNGAPCFVRFGPTAKLTGCTFKRVYVMPNRHMRLVPINRKYAETEVPQEDLLGVWPIIRSYGKVRE